MKWSRRAVWLPALLVFAVLAIAGPATATYRDAGRATRDCFRHHGWKVSPWDDGYGVAVTASWPRRVGGGWPPGVTPWYRVAFSPYLVPFRPARTGTVPGYAERPRHAFNRAEAKIATACRNLGMRRLGPLDGRPVD